MEAKDVIVMIIAVLLTAVIGFLVVAMMQRFMAEGALIDGFFEDIFELINTKATSVLNSTT